MNQVIFYTEKQSKEHFNSILYPALLHRQNNRLQIAGKFALLAEDPMERLQCFVRKELMNCSGIIYSNFAGWHFMRHKQLLVSLPFPHIASQSFLHCFGGNISSVITIKCTKIPAEITRGWPVIRSLKSALLNTGEMNKGKGCSVWLKTIELGNTNLIQFVIYFWKCDFKRACGIACLKPPFAI